MIDYFNQFNLKSNKTINIVNIDAVRQLCSEPNNIRLFLFYSLFLHLFIALYSAPLPIIKTFNSIEKWVLRKLRVKCKFFAISVRVTERVENEREKAVEQFEQLTIVSALGWLLLCDFDKDFNYFQTILK